MRTQNFFFVPHSWQDEKKHLSLFLYRAQKLTIFLFLYWAKKLTIFLYFFTELKNLPSFLFLSVVNCYLQKNDLLMVDVGTHLYTRSISIIDWIQQFFPFFLQDVESDDSDPSGFGMFLKIEEEVKGRDVSRHSY